MVYSSCGLPLYTLWAFLMLIGVAAWTRDAPSVVTTSSLVALSYDGGPRSRLRWLVPLQKQSIGLLLRPTVSCSGSLSCYVILEFNVARCLFCNVKIKAPCIMLPTLVFHERTKHLDIDCHIVRERCTSRLMKLLLVSSSYKTVDIFTKALLPTLFFHFVSKLSMINIYHSQLEGVIALVFYWFYPFNFTFYLFLFPSFTYVGFTSCPKFVSSANSTLL